MLAATRGPLHGPVRTCVAPKMMTVPGARSTLRRVKQRPMQRVAQCAEVRSFSSDDTCAVQAARPVKLPSGPFNTSIGDKVALFAFSAVVAAGAFELVSLAQSVSPFVADLLRASMTEVGTAALVRAMAFLVGATAGPTAAATAQNTTTNSIVPTAAMGASTSMQLVPTKGQQALVPQQGQAISSTSGKEQVPTIIPEICWEVEKGCEMEYYLPLMTPICRQWWYGFWWDKLQTDYIDCCLRAISSSTVNNSIGSRSSHSRVKLISSGSSSSRRALPPVGGSWATRGAVASPSTHLTTLLASSQLLHQASHLAALPGAKRAWLPRASSTCCPGARLPAVPLRQAAATTLPVIQTPAGPNQPIINIPTSSSATPLSKLPVTEALTLKTLALAAAPKPYALLAAPKPPAALIPPAAASLAGALLPPPAQLLAACAASVEDITGRGTFPSHALVDSITSHPLALVAEGELEELEALNNIVELPEGGLEEAGGSGGVPALVTPGGGVAVATRTLTTTFGSAQDKGGKRVQEDRVAAGPLEGGAVSMAAAFDGHAGAGVAAAAASLLPVWLAQAILRDGNTTGFTAECVRLDNHLRLNRAEKSGSTAAVALVTGTTLVTANMGDSTILLVKGDGSVVVLSAQHNTLDEGELARLQAEGAQLRAVPKQGAPGGVMHRIYDAAGVQGLMCSRSLGDFSVKRGGPGLTCIPHLTTTQLDPETDIAIVVVSDGVTDAYDPEVIGLTVSDSLVMGCSAQQVAEELVFAAVMAAVEDNISASVMLLHW